MCVCVCVCVYQVFSVYLLLSDFLRIYLYKFIIYRQNL